MRGTCIHLVRTLIQKGICGLDQSSCRIDDIVEDQAGPSAHIADHVHHFCDIDVGTPFVDDRQRYFQFLSEKSRSLYAARIGTYNGEVRQVQIAEVTHQHWAGKQMVYRDIEEALNLGCMQINEERAVGSGCREQISHQL
jgi:hypothetical protein